MKTLAVIMDDLANINYKKDSTLAMIWEAQNRGYHIYCIYLRDLFLQQDEAYAEAANVVFFENPEHFYEIKGKETVALNTFDLILMRKDPPFDETYIYATYILEHAERAGTIVVNRPQSLRDANEKLFTTNFKDCCPPSLVTQSKKQLRAFWQTHKDIVVKPLNTMGGLSIFRLSEKDVNANVVFETLTKNETTYIMAQKFIPEITKGDKRIILIGGDAFPHALVRVPQGADWRGNLAVGAKGEVQPLTERDKFICERLKPELTKRGLYFVGVDVIGDYLTEINVTSPTGIRELDAALNANISAILFDHIEQH